MASVEQQERLDVNEELAAALGPSYSREEAARAGGYRNRFTAVYVVLGLIAGVAVAALALVGLGDDAPTIRSVTNAWGEFVPVGSAEARAKEIAKQVGRKYVYSTPAEELTGVIPGALTVTANQAEGSRQVVVSAIAVRPTSPVANDISIRDITTTSSEDAMQYMLCGYGQSCSIAKGTPSEARATLLWREALELGLYTFKYIDSINSIIVFMPPPYRNGQPAAAPAAVFLRRQDLERLLQRPLEETLSRATPAIGKIEPAEAEIVRKHVRDRLFRYDWTQAADSSVVLVLDPIREQG
ncbi:MAG: hypothetical protein U0R50_13275 [Gaiellales bacterium]